MMIYVRRASDGPRETVSDILVDVPLLAAAPIASWSEPEARLPLAVLPCGRVPLPIHPYLFFPEEP